MPEFHPSIRAVAVEATWLCDCRVLEFRTGHDRVDDAPRSAPGIPRILFDALPSVALRVKSALPNIDLAVSVAHSFDVQRYGAATGETLLTVDEVISRRTLCSWAWLDEWDRIGPLGTRKSLVYTSTVDRLRECGFKIAAVSPELHATSPAPLGGEAREDTANPERLVALWRKWANLGLDGLCTDHATRLHSNCSL